MNNFNPAIGETRHVKGFFYSQTSPDSLPIIFFSKIPRIVSVATNLTTGIQSSLGALNLVPRAFPLEKGVSPGNEVGKPGTYIIIQ